jgi:hypothetical protein
VRLPEQPRERGRPKELIPPPRMTRKDRRLARNSRSRPVQRTYEQHRCGLDKTLERKRVVLALLILTAFIWLPPLILFLCYDRTRAFLGYNILAFGGIFTAFYAVHLTGIIPGY